MKSLIQLMQIRLLYNVAEPDALVFDIQESLPSTAGWVVTVMDDAMVKYPRIGHTTRIQIEAADAIS